MVKGKLYKATSIHSINLVILCTKYKPKTNTFNGVIVGSNNIDEIGEYSKEWNATAFEEFIGQLSLNNCSLNK